MCLFSLQSLHPVGKIWENLVIWSREGTNCRLVWRWVTPHTCSWVFWSVIPNVAWCHSLRMGLPKGYCMETDPVLCRGRKPGWSGWESNSIAEAQHNIYFYICSSGRLHVSVASEARANRKGLQRSHTLLQTMRRKRETIQRSCKHWSL